MIRITGIQILTVTTISICSIGLLIQLEQISERYFKFQTRSDIQLSIPDSITVPATSTCWYLKDIMKNMKGKDVWQFYEEFDNMTMDQIFEQVSETNEIFVDKRSCAIRLPNKLVNIYPNRTVCSKLFIIERYIQRNFICYKFYASIIDQNQKLDMTEYSLTPTMSGMIYRLSLKPDIFGDNTYFTTFSHSLQTSDLYDSMFSQSLFYYRDNRTKHSFVQMKLTSSGTTIDRLKAPYDTDCHIYDPFETGAEYNYRGLLNETINIFGRIHTFYPISESENMKYKMISSQILSDQTFLKSFNEIYKKYNKTLYDCHLQYLVSKFTLSFGTEVTVDVYWPQDSDILMNYVPVYDLIDYLLYVCSSFGIWFGLSVLSVSDSVISLLSHIFKCHRGTDLQPHLKDVQREVHRLKKSQRLIQIKYVSLMQFTKLKCELLESTIRNLTIVQTE